MGHHLCPSPSAAGRAHGEGPVLKEGDRNLLASAELPQTLQSMRRQHLAGCLSKLAPSSISHLGLCVLSPRPPVLPVNAIIIKIHIFYASQFLGLGWHQPRARPSQGTSNLDKLFSGPKMSRFWSGHTSLARNLPLPLPLLLQCPPGLLWASQKGLESSLKAV